MSDPFDPDAWPHTPSAGESRPDNSNDFYPPRRPADDEDDYDEMMNVDEPKADFGNGDYDYESQTYQPEEYDYDEPAPDTRPRNGGNGGRGAYDDYGDDYDDYDKTRSRGYDDYDDYDDDAPKGGGARKAVFAGFIVVVVLLVAFLGVSALGGKKGAKQATTGTTTLTGASTPAPADVTNGLTQALTAWGQFAVDGNLDDVRPYFVNTGPQFEHFQAEAPDITAKPPGGAPLTMQMQNPKTVKVDANNWLFQGTVVVSRTGEQNQNFPWEIHLTRQSNQQPWQVITVRQF